MRRLFWPCVVVLGVLVVAQVVSLTRLSWISADRNTWVRLTNGRINVWRGEVLTEFKGGRIDQDTSRGAIHFAPVGWEWSRTYTPLNWSTEWDKTEIMIPSGKPKVQVYNKDGTKRAGMATPSHLVDLSTVRPADLVRPRAMARDLVPPHPRVGGAPS